MIYSPISSPIRSAVSSLFANRGGFVPSRLFAAGEQGAWYDPSDWSTLYQDSAGTTPVTAVEQPVGLMLDKSGRGNHATQTTSTSRPVLSARYNLLTKTEQFDDGAWTKSNATVTPNAAVAPDGTMTADAITPNASNAAHDARQTVTPTPSNSNSLTFSVYAKANGYNWVRVQISLTTPNANPLVYFNIATGEVGTSVGNGGIVTGASISSVGNGWYLCTVTATVPSGFLDAKAILLVTNSDSLTTFTGDGTSGIYIWGASLVPANQASIPYQRVNTATDYDADPAKFKPYLKFDGVDDFLVTNSIDFTSTDKMTVFAGVRKLVDAARGMLVELGSSLPTGTFNISAPGAAAPNYSVFSAGSIGVGPVTTPSNYAAPISNVLATEFGISTDLLSIRINGALSASSTGSDQGTGNYSNAPLYIGRRGGTTLPFNGQLYSLIVRGAQTSATQVSQTETWVNGRTGAY